MSRSSPRRAYTAMPYSATSAAATSSCVEIGLDAARWTSAPPAWSVRARFAVSVVTWRQAPMRMPASGCSRSKRSRISRSTGISRSAHSTLRVPRAASPRSVTSWLGEVAGAVIGNHGPWGAVGGGGGVAASGRAVGRGAEQPAEGGREVGPGRADPPDQPLLEASVLGVPELAVGLNGRWVVGADVQDDLVAVAEELGGHRARDGGRVAVTPMIDVGEDVADDAEPRVSADHVRPGGRH